MLDLCGQTVAIWGLGLHGGGLASAQFCAERGAKVIVVDQKPESALLPSINQLRNYDISFQQEGRGSKSLHAADIVVKNPAIPRSHPLLGGIKWVETDLSLFFREIHPPARLIAITGTKGKSTTAALIYHVLSQCQDAVFLAGNSTKSPLSLLPQPIHTLVIELSSFQLGDLQYVAQQRGTSLLPPFFCPSPEIALFTNLYPDHLNYYHDMQDYIQDKTLLFQWQKPNQDAIIYQDGMGAAIAKKSAANVRFFSSSSTNDSSAWIENQQVFLRMAEKIHRLPVEGFLAWGMQPRLHAAMAASLALSAAGVDISDIQEKIPRFPGLPHRLEYLGRHQQIALYNDSAATIPEATLASVASFAHPVHLIAGGTNKMLNLSLFSQIAAAATSIHLLWGSASAEITRLLDAANISYTGPFKDLNEAFTMALLAARAQDCIVFSPGCSSFELYDNEFKRGEHFQQLVVGLIDKGSL